MTCSVRNPSVYVGRLGWFRDSKTATDLLGNELAAAAAWSRRVDRRLDKLTPVW
jgi:hypothetical protein